MKQEMNPRTPRETTIKITEVSFPIIKDRRDYKEVERAIDIVMPLLIESVRKTRGIFYDKFNLLNDKGNSFSILKETLEKIQRLKEKGQDSLYVMGVLNQSGEIVNNTKGYETLKNDIEELYINADNVLKDIIKYNSETIEKRNLDNQAEEERLENQNKIFQNMKKDYEFLISLVEEANKKEIQKKIDLIYVKEAEILEFKRKLKGLED